MEICLYPVGDVRGCDNSFYDYDSDTAGMPYEKAKNISITHYCDPEVFTFKVYDPDNISSDSDVTDLAADSVAYLTNKEALELAALIIRGLLEDGTWTLSKGGIECLEQAYDCLLKSKFDMEYNTEKRLRYDPYWREWKIANAKVSKVFSKEART